MMQDNTQTVTGVTKRSNNYFDGMPISKAHLVAFAALAIAMVFQQMNNNNMAFLAPAVLDAWNLDDVAQSIVLGKILTWFFIGMTLGGLVGGILADKIGRRKALLFSMFLLFGSSIVTGMPVSPTVFIAARAVTGFGVFCISVCFPVYVSEIAPAESRGKWLGLIGTLGMLMVPLCGVLCALVLPMSVDGWRWIFYFGGLGFIAFFIGLKSLKESPRWLVANGRQAEAEQVVFELSGEHIDLSAAAQNIPPKANAFRCIADMFAKQNIRQTSVILTFILCTTPALFMFLSWLGKLLVSMPQIDPATGMALLDDAGNAVMVYSQTGFITMMTIIMCASPIGVALTSFISDKGGRKIPIAVMFFLSSVMFIVCAKAASSPVAMTICGFLLMTFMQAGLYMSFTYIAESYPTYMRSTSSGVHNALGRLAVSGTNILIPLILLSFGGVVDGVSRDLPVLYHISAVLFLIPAVVLLVFGKRTGGKSLEEIS